MLIFTVVSISLIFGISWNNLAFADQMTSTISLGKYVAGSVAVNPQTNMIYVVNPVNNTVSVIDGSSDSVVSTIPVLAGPSGIAVNPITNKIYVSHPSVGNVSVIDGATNSVMDTLSVPGTPTCIATNPGINMIYVLQSSNKNVAIIDGLSNKIVQNIPYRSGYSVYTYCLEVNPSTDKFYVTWATNPNTHMDDYVDVIDGSTYDSLNVHTGIAVFSTSDYGIDKKSNMIYVLNGPSYDNFITINGTSNSVVGTMRVQDNSNGMDVNPYTHSVYLANRDNNTIYVINGTSSTISNTIAVGKSPVDVAVNPNTDKIYVANQGDNTVSVIQGSAPPPQITTSQLRVNSRDALGNILTGFQTQLYAQNGTQIGAGYTSHNFILDNGQSYAVHIEDNTPYEFDHWADTGSTSATRNITISSDDTIIAIYKTLPQSPTGLNATVITSSQINLSWTGPSYDGGSPILGYKIERSTDAGATWSTTVADTGSTQTTYSDSTINANMTYTYRVSAINSVGLSIPSSTAVATSIVLNNIQSTSGTATTSPYSITLANFNSGTGNNRLLVVGISANNNNVASITFNKVPLTIATSSFYNNDAEFWYLPNPSGTGDVVVTMTNSTSAVVGAYSFSGVDLANPIPTIVANHNNSTSSPSVSLMASYPTSLVLDLPSISGWHTLSSPTCAQHWNVNMPNTITGASSSTIVSSHGMVTCSWTASSGGDLWDDVAIEVKSSGFTSSITSPESPTGLKATVSSSQINLSWNAPTNNGGSVITNYNVYRGTTFGNETLLTQIGNVTSYNDNAVTNGQTYFYKVTAINSVGESAPSNEVSATPIGPPQPPTGLTATGALLKINLSWNPPSNDGGSPITGYMIEKSTDNGNTWFTIQSNTGSTAATYSDSNVVPLVTYTYRVSSINSAGISNPSNTASATTTSSSTNGITLNNVQSTSGMASSSNQITLANFDSGNGNNKLLVVGVGADSSDVASVTFGGTSLTQRVHSFYNNDAEFWYLKNPSGTGDIVVTMNGPTSAVVGAYSFSGVNQTSPLPTSTSKHNTTPNSPNITLTTKFANDWMLDLPSIYGGSTLSSPTCTQQWDANIPDVITDASSSKMVPIPDAVTCKWTASSGDLWDDVAVEVKASK